MLSGIAVRGVLCLPARSPDRDRKSDSPEAGACPAFLRSCSEEEAAIVQYTIRGIPREVDCALRRKAAQSKRSLNQVIVDELTEATVGRKMRADFSDLVGRWTPDRAFDEIVAAQRQIHRDQWR